MRTRFSSVVVRPSENKIVLVNLNLVGRELERIVREKEAKKSKEKGRL